MLSTKYSVQLLARNFRTSVRYMCEKPHDSIVRDGKWTETKVTEENIETLTGKNQSKNENDRRTTSVKPEQIGTGGQYTDNRHLKPPPLEHPISRTGRILAEDVRSLKHYFPFNLFEKGDLKSKLEKHILPDFNGMYDMVPVHDKDRYIFPSHVDICIIGGGAIGSSIAYFLKEKAKHGLNIAVVEKDKTVSEKIDLCWKKMY